MKFASCILTVFFLMGIILLLPVTYAFSQDQEMSKDEEIKALKEKVDVLEQKIDFLANDFGRRLYDLEKVVFPDKQPSAELEKEAQEAINAINELIATEQIALAREKLDAFVKTYRNTKSVASAEKLHQEISVIGMASPTAWGIKNWFQGEKDIDLNTQGTLLVFFWETWCGYCRREAPKIQSIYTDYKDSGLQVIGLTKMNRSSTPEKVSEFIKENSISYPIALEDGSLSNYFKVRGIPAAALISKGKIVWRGNPVKLPEQLLKKYLGIPVAPKPNLNKSGNSPSS